MRFKPVGKLVYSSNFRCILRVTAGHWARRLSKFDWYSSPVEHLHSLHSTWLRPMSQSVATEISRLLHGWEQCRCTHGRGCGVRWLVLWCRDLRPLNGNYRVRRKQPNVAVRRTAKTSYIAPGSSALLPIYELIIQYLDTGYSSVVCRRRDCVVTGQV